MIRTLLAFVVVGMAVLALAVPLPEPLVERLYSRGIYLAMQPVLTRLSNLVPFALFDIAVGAAVVAAILAAIALARRLFRPGRIRGVWRWGLRVAVAACAVYLLFLACWGLNYERLPLTAKLEFRPDRPQPDAVVALASEAAGRLRSLHDEAHSAGWPGWQAFPRWLGPAFTRAQEDLAPGRSAVPGRPKPSLLTFFFARAGVDGMTDPFALEVLVNGRLLPFERPFIVAHEWAHLAGYADESEANFTGWLTCLRGPVGAQYSGWLFLFSELAGSVPRAERARLATMLGDGPRADLRAVYARQSAAEQPLVRSVSWHVYDRYLRANRVERGVASYDRVVLLVLGTRFRPGWVPVRAGDTVAEVP